MWCPSEQLLDEVGDRRFAGAGEPGEPEDRTASGLSAPRARALSTSSACQWMLVARRRAKSDHAGAAVSLVNRSIRMKPPVVAVSRRRRRRAARRRELQKPISFSSSVCAATCSSVLTSTLCLSGHRGRHRPGPELAAGRSGPGSSGSSLIQTRWAANWSATSRPRVRRDQHVAARDVDLVVERQRDGVAGRAPRRDRRHGDDTCDLARLPDVRDHDRGRPAAPCRRRRAGRSRGNRGRAVDPLHRKTERLAARAVVDVDMFRDVEQARPVIPGRVARSRR